MAIVVAVLLSWCVSSLLLAVPLGRAISANFSGRLIEAGRSDAALRSSLARTARTRAHATKSSGDA